MKTTIEIPDPLREAARETAQREGSTLRNLVEEGPRLALEQRQRSGCFRLRDASVSGEGLHPELEGASWEILRDLAYEVRGG